MNLIIALALLLQEPPKEEKAEREGLLKDWELSAQVYAYRIREDRDYLQPTITAAHDWLHLEGRYNYENHDTGSLWAGYNLSIGTDLKLDLTPMIGVVFGQTAGIAPGLEASLTWNRFTLYVEYEYLFDTGNRDDSYSYSWSELTFDPVEWLSVGLVVQRTRVYETSWDSQRGFLARVFIKSLEITFCYFNPTEDPVYVLGLGITF